MTRWSKQYHFFEVIVACICFCWKSHFDKRERWKKMLKRTKLFKKKDFKRLFRINEKWVIRVLPQKMLIKLSRNPEPMWYITFWSCNVCEFSNLNIFDMIFDIIENSFCRLKSIINSIRQIRQTSSISRKR